MNTNDDLRERRKEDFDFMVMCAAKNNMAMYHLLRDRSLDNQAPSAQELGEIEYRSWFTNQP